MHDGFRLGIAVDFGPLDLVNPEHVDLSFDLFSHTDILPVVDRLWLPALGDRCSDRIENGSRHAAQWRAHM